MMQFIKTVTMMLITTLSFCFVPAVAFAEISAEDIFTHKIQPLFDNRCLSCHSCFNAPCQLNLQNFEGFARGANKLNVYDGTRTKSVSPSRIWIDAKSTEEWRTKNFFTVHTSIDPEKNVFFQMLNLRAESSAPVKVQAHESQVCAANMDQFNAMKKSKPELGMPYGLPALQESELETIKSWISKGAPGPSVASEEKQKHVPAKLRSQVEMWEKYLNKQDLKQKLISRYIYEHLFLAHIYFPEESRDFFRLIRSKTSCDKPDEIATRRPNDDPEVKNFYYCLIKFPGTIVAKTHLPYEFSNQKLERFKTLFNEPIWQIKELPTYASGVAENPFITFQDIPVKSRYQFLLDDAQYHVATFIKGPVCNGSMAVNSIQEQFYTFFINPDADNMVLSKDYEKKAAPLLALPGSFGSDVEFTSAPLDLKRITDHREGYRKLRSEELIKNRPDGYVLNDIWNGDGKNDNAVLTIFRHDQNAVVMKGAVGDLSKTVFVLDYPLFERLVYNLVVNFDVFGNVGHQLLTRVYMDMIRMEAEELFLRFLPPEERLQYRRNWYQGILASAKMAYIFPPIGSAEPTGVRFTKGTQTKRQMVEKILFYHMNDQVRGIIDDINWRKVAPPDSLNIKLKATGLHKELRKISAVPAGSSTPFARYFPDIAYVMVKGKDKTRVFTLIHNKEHENISWITGESLRMAPQEDTLTVREGYWASYPNMIFQMEEKDLMIFANQVTRIKDAKSYDTLVDKWGVRRQNPKFWSYYDELQSSYLQYDRINAGYLDLTRYDL
ncbi:fatty acid cis/trans isomerase [Bdellovibrio sp. SKB1291214]|uniref:fatty acid cis/trans isomerase n=1 Tax=Bdellovibrio sp. SKB1291214 TaxID=1732569 RepID=UPI0020CF8462|nr:fatty acid cis/trans isomerase [Bdellovibrio sp. SKB1291214]UYL08324.1 fatty acid cis/trans isomerase [Bdellovibrio sp. SKB1291214]